MTCQTIPVANACIVSSSSSNNNNDSCAYAPFDRPSLPVFPKLSSLPVVQPASSSASSQSLAAAPICVPESLPDRCLLSSNSNNNAAIELPGAADEASVPDRPAPLSSSSKRAQENATAYTSAPTLALGCLLNSNATAKSAVATAAGPERTYL